MRALNTQVVDLSSTTWGFSSAGRAPALQAGGQRFDPANLHQDSKEDKKLTEVPWKQDASLSFLKLKYVP